MMRIVQIAGLATVLLAAPLAIEYAIGDEEFELIDFGVDVLELLILAGAIVAVALLVLETRDLRRNQNSLIDDLSQTRSESRKWRDAERTKIEGFRSAIEAQFKEWKLSEAEHDVAILLLKGCSHKQIALARDCSDTTVRQQAQSIYRKSHLKNRSELAAYFLDAVLEPTDL